MEWVYLYGRHKDYEAMPGSVYKSLVYELRWKFCWNLVILHMSFCEQFFKNAHYSKNLTLTHLYFLFCPMASSWAHLFCNFLATFIETLNNPPIVHICIHIRLELIICSIYVTYLYSVTSYSVTYALTHQHSRLHFQKSQQPWHTHTHNCSQSHDYGFDAPVPHHRHSI